MPSPCGITFDGKKYTPEQFMAKLMDGSLDSEIMPSAKQSLPSIESAKQKLAEAKRKKQELLDKKKNLGAVKDPFSDAEEMAKADREIFDAYVDLAKGYIAQGVKSVKEFAAELGEEVNDLMNRAWTEAVSGGGTKKTFATKRAYEGTIREEVKKELEKYGLTREIESQEKAMKDAKSFIESVGEDAALEAVRNGDVQGGGATAIFGSLIQEYDNKVAKAENDVQAAEFIQKQAELINELENRLQSAGRQSAMMDFIYKTTDIGYNVEKKINEYKESNNGEIPKEVEEKFRQLGKELEDVKKRLKEAEEKAIQQEAQKAVDEIKASVKRSAPKEKPIIYGKQRVAKGLDDLASALGAKLSVTGAERAKVTEALTEIGRGLIEIGEANINNVAQKVKEYVKEKFGDKINFDDYESDFVSNILAEKSDENVRVPNSLIRSLVGKGIDNIDDLTKAVKEAVKEDYPNATDREIRDAITGYGKTVNQSQDQISKTVRKLKDVGRILSALEDVATQKRPLKSGQQRDKLDAQQRELRKQLREAMKDLPLTESELETQLSTQLDAAKARVRNQIEDLQREIDRGEQTPKNARTVREDAELKELKERRDKLREEYDKIFKDEEYKNAKRLELAKKATQKRIEDLQRKIKEGDFSKPEKKPIIEDSELTKLRAEKKKIQEEFDKEIYKAKLQNRTKVEKAKDLLLDAWQVPRAVLAGFEFSFVGVQGLKLTISQLYSNPRAVRDAFANAYKSFRSIEKQEQFMREIESQDWYRVAEKSKLSLTKPSAEMLAAEELSYTGWTDSIWKYLGNIVLSPTLLKGKENYKKAVDAWGKANPMKPFERAAVGYLNTIRSARFIDGMNMLETKGYTPEKNIEEYKKLADYINTMTGRASLGTFEKNSKLLTTVFFSPRNWASGIKLGTPYAFIYFGNQSPTVRKMAVMDMSKFLGTTTGMVMLAATQLNNDDDPETGVEFDPRSSDFMKIKWGRGRVQDPWGGYQQQIVFSTRMIMESLTRLGIAEGSYKKDGEIMQLGDKRSPTQAELISMQALNKLNPSARLLYNYAKSHKNQYGEYVDDHWQPYTVRTELEENAINIFVGTLYDLLKEDPQAIDGILAFYALFGGGVNVYEPKEKGPKVKRMKVINP